MLLLFQALLTRAMVGVAVVSKLRWHGFSAKAEVGVAFVPWLRWVWL